VSIRKIADVLLRNGKDAQMLEPQLTALSAEDQSSLDSMALRCIHCGEWHPTEAVARLSKC